MTDEYRPDPVDGVVFNPNFVTREGINGPDNKTEVK